jgi:uncharacterized membrane protein YeaQ/YmgE (transglycosylase-associated protein family)
MIFAVLWEVLEHFVFLPLGLKFENRADSWENMSMDVVLGAIGGLGTWLFAYITFEKDKNSFAYYTFGIIGFGVWISIFIVLRYLTFHNSPII